MLKHKPVMSRRFNNFNDLRHVVEHEEECTQYNHIPMEIIFQDDEYINNQYKFNTQGIKALCGATEVNGLFNAMDAVEEPHMSSTFLNTLINQDDIRNKLAGKRLVIVGDTIVGVVGSRYMPYSNRQFLDDLFKDNNNQTLALERATLTCTKMTANFVEQHQGFKMKDGEDYTKIGISVKNDGIGYVPVSSKIWTLRPKCLNGMMHLVDKGISYAKHTGIEEAMRSKLDRIITLAKDQYEVIQERVKTLTQVPYTNTTAKTFLQLQAPFDIIPEVKKQRLYNPKKKYADVLAHQKDLDRSIKVLDDIPTTYGGPHTLELWNSGYRDKHSMYDYVEAFTEHAQKRDEETQLEIEAGAGILTAWVNDHKEELGYLPF